MKRIIIATATFFVCLTASAQFYYQDAANVDMLRHSSQTESHRQEIVLPQVNGYNVYKADLHTHSIYSDGDVTPEYRVREAWQDGLDVLAITEHVEYRRHEGNMINFLPGYVKKGTKPVNTNVISSPADKNGICADLNYPVSLAVSASGYYGITVIPGAEITRVPGEIGHYNALFTVDNNTIYDADPAESMRKARAQGALIMQNHPGWTRKDVSMMDFEKKVYAEGLIDGIEIMNGSEFYPIAINRALDNGFFMSSNTDAHDPATSYRLNGTYRNMTFILAADKSLESLKEALLEHRSLAYAFGTLAGREHLLKDFFLASIDCQVVSTGNNGQKNIKITNTTSLPYLLDMGGNPVILEPFTSIIRTVAKDGSLKFTVENMWCSEKGHPEIVISL